MKKFLIVLILAGLAGGVLYWRELPGAPDDASLKLFGSVEIRQAVLGFRVPGRLEYLHYEEGEKVSAGDVLAALDPVPYEIRRDQVRAALNQTRANLAKVSGGNRPEEVRQAVARRARIQASLDLAEKNHDRLAALFSQRAVARKDLDDAVAARDALRAELAAADSALALTREGFRAEDIEAAAAAVELAEAQLRDAENSLADTKLRAPADGVILTRAAEPGAVLAAGQPVCALMLLKPVQVRAYVTEPQLGSVRLGMKGKIFTDSPRSGSGSGSAPEFLWGTVGFIASEAEFTPKHVQTEDLRTSLVYRIRLLVGDPPEGFLKNGMPVTVILEP
ncbi:MAG: HlyD family efflux transporter periplasmic adaptor subunit [Synergistaceae bacterium]|jgi:HlyD family secretion protein|nr:HlyD family efflux transporter periplasmic adaptor subunit [Synergistaceae bacterium]